jgi:hypothetical protein
MEELAMKYEKLSDGLTPTNYKKNGYTLKMVKFDNPKALYEVWGTPMGSKDLKLYGYEIHILRNQTGKYNENGIRYPSNEEWGMYGWSADNLAYANKIYTEVTI